MSEPEREIDVPVGVRAGVWANDLTFDFVRLEPRDLRTGVVVARVTLPPSCILKLKAALEAF